jgi:hypothetical protein
MLNIELLLAVAAAVIVVKHILVGHTTTVAEAEAAAGYCNQQAHQ